jgi:hypothetical protein
MHPTRRAGIIRGVSVESAVAECDVRALVCGFAVAYNF